MLGTQQCLAAVNPAYIHYRIQPCWCYLCLCLNTQAAASTVIQHSSTSKQPTQLHHCTQTVRKQLRRHHQSGHCHSAPSQHRVMLCWTQTYKAPSKCGANGGDLQKTREWRICTTNQAQAPATSARHYRDMSDCMPIKLSFTTTAAHPHCCTLCC
jgi:hypothetical protein